MKMALAADLTNEELAVLAKDDDKDALGMLISRNEGFVVFLAFHFLEKRGWHDHPGTCDIEDYKQICRLAIIRAVNNYKDDSSAKFMTYAGKIMHRDMARQFSKDLSYREYMKGTIAEDKDILAEECDEEYGDAYDNDFENKKAVNLENVLPSLQRKYSQMIKADTENQQSEEDFMHMDPFVFFYTPADAPEAEKAEIKTEHKKNKHKSVYIGEKKTNDSWEYPVYHKALNNLQMEAMLEALYDKDFDEAQREYLIYRYGLENQDPQKLKETAEHFNLTLANARKIEKAGLDTLRKKLQGKKLI